MAEATQDRFDVSGRRASAAVEWRTIPPTIDVRYKRRPPPLTLLTRRPSEVSVLSPGPLDTSTTASSFTLSTAPSLSPRSAASQLEFTFKRAPLSPGTDHLISPRRGMASMRHPLSTSTPEAMYEERHPARSEVERAICSPVPDLEAPEDPIRHLLNYPWDYAEYLHLLSVCTNRRHSSAADWDAIASVHNNASSVRRSAWDCWHRWAVPWTSDIPGDAFTYPDVPGVKHRYRHVDIRTLTDLYTVVAGSVGEAGSIPKADNSSLAGNNHSQARHPSYPARSEPPNVPARTLGDVTHRGILPWFRATAVNTTMLQLQHNLRGGESDVAPGTLALPPHLRTFHVPPPPPRGDG